MPSDQNANNWRYLEIPGIYDVRTHYRRIDHSPHRMKDRAHSRFYSHHFLENILRCLHSLHCFPQWSCFIVFKNAGVELIYNPSASLNGIFHQQLCIQKAVATAFNIHSTYWLQLNAASSDYSLTLPAVNPTVSAAQKYWILRCRFGVFSLCYSKTEQNWASHRTPTLDEQHYGTGTWHVQVHVSIMRSMPPTLSTPATSIWTVRRALQGWLTNGLRTLNGSAYSTLAFTPVDFRLFPSFFIYLFINIISFLIC